jgi:glutamate/tyrosine decarboxylase-like PLP-dependent enzyme
MSNREFPERGIVWKVLERELWEARSRDDDVSHEIMGGVTWPNPGGNVHLAAKEAAGIYFNAFLLGRYTQPSVAKIKDEVTAMAREMLSVPDDGHLTLTYGGTESNFLAVLAARNWARENLPEVKTPTIVAPYSAHPSFNKAAHYLGLEVVRVPCRADYRADVAALADAVTGDTIMLVGSAPPYPHGLVDPIADIGALAIERGLWLHVDACVGGYLIPFLKKLGCDLPDYDLNVPGVRSLSADLHKFGFTPTGVSTISLRHAEDVVHHRFAFDDWPYGNYTVDVFPGSKSATMIAAAWAVMKHLGADGYLNLARALLRTQKRLVEGVTAIPGLRLLAEPEAGIVVYTSDEGDVGAVAEGLAERGHAVGRVKEPPAIHHLMEPVEDDRFLDAYLASLAEVVDEVRAGRRKATGKESIYA